MNNILYTTHCPVCQMVENRLREKNVPYEICEDKEKMKNLGFTYVPMFYCAEHNKNMKAQEALLWINKQGGKSNVL